MRTWQVLSDSGEPFRDRVEAGRLLGRELEARGLRNAVVLGIPRGGVVVGREVARAINAELDIVIARKLGAPGNPELAIGAISEDGRLFVDERLASQVGADSTYIEEERDRQLREVARRAESYRKARPKVSLRGRPAIVTDDGVATGATAQAALRAVRQEQPEVLILALPVGPPETLRRLARDADEVLCLRAPAFFAAVGQFYVVFDQTQDEELLRILQEEAGRAGRAP
jgi:predicted phosphoribosyltransferase